MIFRADRRNRGNDPFVHAKTLLFTLGALFGLAGIGFDKPLMVTIGIITLALGILLRLVRTRRADPDRDASDGERFE